MSPPLVYKDKDKLKGMDLDVIVEFCKQNGIRHEFKAFPWKRALMNIKEGEADGIFTLFRTKEREEFLYYPSVPINTVKTVIWARKESGIKIRELNDLKSHSLGVIAGYKYGSQFDNLKELKKTFCDTKEQLIKMLNKQRFDLAADSEACFKFMCKKIGLEQSKFEIVYVLTQNPVYFAFSKSLGERGAVLAEKFSQFMKLLQENGALEQIRNHYYQPDNQAF
ncbi:substrate-binding periplasmic protein [Desulfonema magnum]|nr:transporter substrate-binding domain-containing protein [Desulfonema magnum]